MTLDPQTLLAVNIANLAALALLLSVIMGRDLSDAARTARRSIIVHAGAWVAVIVSELCSSHRLNLTLSTVSMACYSGSNWLLFTALEGWLGPRRFGRALRAVAFAMPIGYLSSAFSNLPGCIIYCESFYVEWNGLRLVSRQHETLGFSSYMLFSKLQLFIQSRKEGRGGSR